MARNVSSKRNNVANNRPFSLKATKNLQKVNLQKVTLEDGTKVRLSSKEIRTLNKKANTK